ncbi:MAG: NAD(P)H-binding protein [Deltaproteobacteria bacterium]|nr:NAD(P)H-binding protein [Deltaproteobacteria bacterium]
MILITGATGNIGSNLAFILSKAKVPIKLMVREKKRLAKALLEEDINIVKADYGDTKSLYSAFEGVEKAFLVCSGDPDMTRFEANFIETAKKASISHIVKISITGGGPKALFSTGRWHYESEVYLKILVFHIQFSDHIPVCAKRFFVPRASTARHRPYRRTDRRNVVRPQQERYC